MMGTDKKSLLIIFGTRPEAIKLAPVCLAIQKNKDFSLTICNTGQQREMAEKTLSFFDLQSDLDLDVMKNAQSLFTLQNLLMEKLFLHLAETTYDGVIVQGDTMSAFCGALAAFYSKIPVFHVEAGLRGMLSRIALKRMYRR